MKRLTAMLCALLLVPALASAEFGSIADIREQAQELGGWQRTYEAHGRTIEVDIPVIVPETDVCPVMTVDMAIPLTDEQVDEIVEKSVIPGKNGTYRLICEDEAPEIPMTVMLWKRLTDITDPHQRQVIWVYRGKHEYLYMNKIGSDSELPQTFLRAWQTDMDAAIAEENDVTPREVVSILEQMLAQVYPEDRISFVPVRFTAVDMERKAVSKHDEKHAWTEFGERVESNDTPGYIELVADQTISGLPVLAPISYFMKYIETEWAKIGDKLDRLAVMLPYMELEYMSDTAYYLRTEALRPVDMLAQDIPLASLDDILKALEAEIEAGHIRAVRELRLGYAMYWTEDGRACVYPIWEALCGYEAATNEEWDEEQAGVGINGVDPYQIGILTRVGVNAQTGELYDPSKFDADMIVCPRIITWDEVQ